MKILSVILLTFIAYVKIPAGISKVYDNVISWRHQGDMTIVLILNDGRMVLVPSFFTIIEEKEPTNAKRNSSSN